MAGGRSAGVSRRSSPPRRETSLVNVGATAAMQREQIYGYPVCTVCGQSVSPLSSERQMEHFEKSHEERCGRKPVPVGFYADVVADVLSLPACANPTTAFSVLEAIRIGATRVLDMHMEDLQLLVIGHVDRDDVDGLLWDPMPGGSGLLEQLCERFEEIVAVAQDVVEHCPGECEKFVRRLSPDISERLLPQISGSPGGARVRQCLGISAGPVARHSAEAAVTRNKLLALIQ